MHSVNYVDNNSDFFNAALRGNGLKVTPQRKAILEMINEAGHISIDDLYKKVLNLYPKVSLATIYKNILSLKSASIINELKISGREKYELNYKSHIHLLCDKCGNLQDMDLDINAFINDAKFKSGYEIKGINIVLNGICKACH